MSDRLFASGGDPAPGRRPGSGRAPYRHDPAPDTPPFPSPAVPSAEAAAVGVARRLQARLERHQRLLAQIHPEPTQLRELTETVRRMRRDVESIVLLNGDDPSGHIGGPRRLSEVLDDAAAAAEETWRILVRPAAAATVDPGAAVELTYVLAELLDHVTAAYPDAGIDVASYVTASTGLTVEVSVNSAGRYLPDGLGTRRAAATAEAHARRSRSHLALSLPTDTPPAGGTGVVATLSCPAAAITMEEPAWSSVVATDRQQAAAPAADPLGSRGWDQEWNGNGHQGNGSYGAAAGYGNGSYGNGGALNGYGGGLDTHGHYGNGAGTTTVGLDDANSPEYSPSVSSRVDELFGPMVDLPPEEPGDGQGTPIFEAIASAWFREEAGAPDQGPPAGGGPADWETPSDGEWRAAAERAARSESDPVQSTASGLPRRRPGNQLVPPPRSTGAAPSEAAERVPDRVRNRLSTYQRGLRQGRHRAPAPDSDRW